MKQFLRSVILGLLFFCCSKVHAQDPVPQAYPRVMMYMSVSEPLIFFSGGRFSNNFSHGSNITFPVGVNLLKSDEFGISFEISPSIHIEKGLAKTNGLLFHPGTMFRFKHGFTLITRAAFDSNGRFGFTPVYNFIIHRTKLCNYFIAASNPVRFGNNQPSSIGLNFQIGTAF